MRLLFFLLIIIDRSDFLRRCITIWFSFVSILLGWNTSEWHQQEKYSQMSRYNYNINFHSLSSISISWCQQIDETNTSTHDLDDNFNVRSWAKRKQSPRQINLDPIENRNKIKRKKKTEEKKCHVPTQT